MSSTQFQIVGINDIPADEINQNIVYVVPENKRIRVKAGDMIGWAYTTEAALQYSLSTDTADDTHLFYIGGLLYDSLKDSQIHTFAHSTLKSREYSIFATIEPFKGKLSNANASHIII